MMKVIFFDLGGVLFTNGTKRFIELLSSRFNIDSERIREVMEGELGSLYREAKISRDEFWQKLLKELQIRADIGTLEKEWIDGYKLIEGTKELIQELAKKYRIYFLSDNVKERVDIINKRHNFLSWFEGGVFSHEAGVRKPHPLIYKRALEKAQVQPEEAVFIDDKAHFLIPAKEMGMLTFAFETPEKLRQSLKAYHLID